MIDNLRPSAELKIHLTMDINIMSSRDGGKSQSGNNINKIIHELFPSLLTRY